MDDRADVSCVVANVEYETWFVAAWESLARAGLIRPGEGEAPPFQPEGQRLRKKWIEDRFVSRGEREGARGGPGTRGRYSPTRDQAAMTRAMDLRACRRHSPSFDKLCRELARRLGGGAEERVIT